MSKVSIKKTADFIVKAGKTLGTSEWFVVSQEVIDSFADATRDHQWIHTDICKAKAESPFCGTIAHGYLVISLIPSFLDEIIAVSNLEQLVNYKIKDFTFKNAIKVDSLLRMSATLKSVKDIGKICQATLTCTFEVKGQNEPVAEGDITFLYYFN